MKRLLSLLSASLLAFLFGCEKAPPMAAPDALKASTTATEGAETKTPPAPLDPAVVSSATGLSTEVADGVVRVSLPRNEIKVEVDNFPMPPFMGLTSWAGFTPGEAPGVEAMVMGDFVLFEDEVDDAMSAALSSGLKVTALHNHFFFDKPHVYFMHIEGEGATVSLGKAVKSALDAAKAIRAKSTDIKNGFPGPAIGAKNAIDGEKIKAALGRAGVAKDGMYKVTIGRPAATAACGCKIGKAMGVNTWAGFAGTDENAVVDGDFAVTEGELQPVLKSLRGSSIHVVAIHHHMIGEEPRILFLHYWGKGPSAELAASVKKALDLTKTSG